MGEVGKPHREQRVCTCRRQVGEGQPSTRFRAYPDVARSSPAYSAAVVKASMMASSQRLVRIGLVIIFVLMTLAAGRALLAVELSTASPASSAMPHPTPDPHP